MSIIFFIFIGSLAKTRRYRPQRTTCFFLKNKDILEHHHKDTHNLFNRQIKNMTICQVPYFFLRQVWRLGPYLQS